MTIDLYYDSWSPPCRTVMLVAKILNVRFNPILTNPGRGDTQKPEYKQVRDIRIFILFRLVESRVFMTCRSPVFLKKKKNWFPFFIIIVDESTAHNTDHRRRRVRLERKVSAENVRHPFVCRQYRNRTAVTSRKANLKSFLSFFY